MLKMRAICSSCDGVLCWRLHATTNAISFALVQHNASRRHSLIEYTQGSAQDLACLLHRPFCVRGAHEYYLLDSSLSLRESLRGKTLVEFPSITVVTRASLGEYVAAVVCAPRLCAHDCASVCALEIGRAHV